MFQNKFSNPAFPLEFTAAYSTFIGKDSSYRHFHYVILKFTPSELWSLAAQGDIGFQNAVFMAHNGLVKSDHVAVSSLSDAF